MPKDSIVVPNLWEVHHDPDTWTDPNVFRPERFLNSDTEFVNTDQVIPFSVGARRCPGETLAKAEIFTLLPRPFTVTITPK